ncbi:anthranilate phosphoribosyltransferase [candidate division KSB1 bacterium]
MIREAIKKVVEFEHLNEYETAEVMESILDGHATEAQISAFITGLRMKGETVEEIIGLAKVMREKAVQINVDAPNVIDTCGTGGDGKHTLNVSTIAAFVAAGAGITVAKHGNRSVSSKCGSADLLAALGVNLDLSPEKIEECIRTVHLGFLFAPALHQAMKYALNPRKEIAIRTVFNILGPLTNPARVKNQLIGVFDETLTKSLANVLKGMGSIKAFVVHGKEGLDEISITGTTTVSELVHGHVKTYTVKPEDFGLQRRKLTEIAGGDAETNKNIALSILHGDQGAGRDVVILNSGFAIASSNPTLAIDEGIAMARDSIDSGNALKKAKELVEFSNS